MDLKRITNIIMPVIKSYDMEITSLSFRYYKSGALLRVYVDRKITSTVPHPYPGSPVGLKMLERISKEITAAISAYGIGGKRCSIEVSSPGLDRPIASDDEYKFFINHPVKVMLKDLKNERRKFTGKLISVEEAGDEVKSISIETDQGLERIDISGIEKTRLNPLLPEPSKKKKKGKKKWHGK